MRRIAAEAGLAEAQYNLALLYAEGQGVTRSDAEANAWLAKAAQHGYAPAKERLAAVNGAARGGENQLSADFKGP